MYAEIIIPLALPKNYTWSIPDGWPSGLVPGCRVELSLRNKKYAGIIKRIHNEKPDAFEPRELLSVLDSDPIVYAQQLSLWQWIAQYYMCSEGEVMAAALPAHFKLSSETVLVYNEAYGDDFSGLGHEEWLVAEALLEKKELKLASVQKILAASQVYPVIKGLLEKKVCIAWESLQESYKPRMETYIQLNPAYAGEDAMSTLLNEDRKLQRAGRQMELLLGYLHLAKTEGEVTRAALLKKSGASDAQLRGLIEKGILQAKKLAVGRVRYLPETIDIDFALTELQQQAFQAINNCFAEKQTCLLHGVTSSGKTEIYIRMMEQYIRQGKQVLYLLPEIALTSQIIRRLEKHFGGHIGVYHSRFSQNERIEIWNKIRTGALKIVLGARSALFMPFENLGLVIADEEHDPSYKQQEPAPRYHARDAAIYYASLFDARVLLGSATPSLETYFNALSGKYGLVSLQERYGQLPMPAIEIVDTKKYPTGDKTKPVITPPLVEAVEHSLKEKKQIILFQNRRGYSPYQVCQVCGWIPQCKNCDVSLTYHKLTDKLHCHYCGTVYPAVSTCAACGNHRFAQRNFGTERIEEHLGEIFPDARVARMDIDSVRGKSAHEQLIQRFEQRKIDILVGTQMVVKGLDFENVDLVGILDADSLLHFAEFRVNERAFQLMEQVSGRAGRKSGGSRVMIQVADTRHPVLGFVQKHDYAAFYAHELDGRKKFFYPPFSRVILVHFRHKLKEVVESAAALFANNLRKDLGNYLVGPAEPVVSRVRNQYLMELLLKLPKDSHVLQMAKLQIQQQTVIIQHHPKFKSVTILPDVDAI